MAAFVWLGVGGTFVGAADAATVYGLAVVLLALGATQRQWPALDRRLAIIGALFAALCWISWSWSFAPIHTFHGALQITAVFIGGLILLGEAEYLTDDRDHIFRAALFGITLGAGLALFDFLIHHPIMGRVIPSSTNDFLLGSKMGRGLDYLLFLAWPLGAYAWHAKWRFWALALAGMTTITIAISYDITAKLSVAAGLAALLVALVAPWLVAGALALGAVIAATLTPVIALDFGKSLLPLAARIKPSAVHRLEIWDYMSRRAFERPWTGWGWWTARDLPIRPEELARYKYVTPAGSPHPHGNWVQLWVETGVVGVALGLVFALLVIWRVWRMPKPYRPFGLACATSVFVIALASFDLASDSWWAVLAATATLFAILPKPAAGNPV